MNKLDNRFTEGEITSMVRRFFIANGFKFLSSSQDGEKLYYTLPQFPVNFKQPDTIVVKDGLVIICEDKILYRDLFTTTPLKISDYEKLSQFLGSEKDLEIFTSKISKTLGTDDFEVIGCLSSLTSNGKKTLLPHNILNITISPAEIIGNFLVNIEGNSIFDKYFVVKELEIVL